MFKVKRQALLRERKAAHAASKAGGVVKSGGKTPAGKAAKSPGGKKGGKAVVPLFIKESIKVFQYEGG